MCKFIRIPMTDLNDRFLLINLTTFCRYFLTGISRDILDEILFRNESIYQDCNDKFESVIFAPQNLLPYFLFPVKLNQNCNYNEKFILI